MKTDRELIAEYKHLLQLEFPEDAAYLIIAAEDEILRRMAGSAQPGDAPQKDGAE